MTFRQISIVALATGAFAFSIYLLLPAGVVAFHDDFGYLRSVVLTIRHGFPVTDDWLEPWAASLSGLSALLFALTGSFSAAVFLPQIFGAAVLFLVVGMLLRARSYSVGASLAVALLLASSPVVLAKWLEFTALVLYLPCLAAALWGYERGRWWQFFLFWAIAVASRQTAALWLIVPLWHVGAIFLRQGRASGLAGLAQAAVQARGLLAWLTAAIVLFVVLILTINQTHSQAVTAAQRWREFDLSNVMHHAITGLVFVAGAIGLSALASAFRPGFSPRRASWPWLAAAMIVAGVILLTLLQPNWLGIVTNGWAAGRANTVYLTALSMLAVLGIVAVPFSLRAPYAAAALASVVAFGLRPVLYDYYLIEPVLFAYLAVVPKAGSTVAAARSWPGKRALGLGLAALVLLWHANLAAKLARRLDDAHAAIVLSETAMRRGALMPSELVYAPFGYAGWKLNPYFVAQDRERRAPMLGFLAYLDPPGSVIVDITALEADAPSIAGQVIQSDMFGSMVSYWHRFWLVRLRPMPAANSGRVALDQVDPFPLNDAEWRAFVAGQPVVP